jgi:Putative zinc-finger
MKLPSRNTQDAHVNVDLLSGYLDNQVAPLQRAYVERHVRTCVSCQLELQSLRQTVVMLQALPRVPVPRAFTLSEVQVGRHARAGAAFMAPWFGGLARVAGVMAGLAVIAVTIAALRQSAFAPAAQVARAPVPAVAPSAITEAPPATIAAAVAPAAASAASGAPQVSAQESPTAAAQEKQALAQPPVTQRPGQSAAAGAPTAIQRARSAGVHPTATTASGQELTAPSAAPALQAPTVANTEGPTASPVSTEAPLMALAEPSAAAPSAAVPLSAAAAAAPAGLGGGSAGSADSRMAAIPPPLAPISATLPATAGLAYADGRSVWALDRSGGQRKLVDQPGANLPVVSPDKSLVAFWVTQNADPELWVVGWDGSAPHRLLAQQELPKDGPDSAYSAPQFVLHDLGWVPSTHVLAFQTYSPPAGSQTEGHDELWNLDGNSGALHQVLDVGMNSALAYSPDGKQIALMQRGTTEQPIGNLALYRADGSGKRKVLDLPANPSGAGYDAQLSWLPDSRSLWVGVAIPAADTPGQITSVTLYRVPLSGSPVKAGQVQAPDAYWSPDGKHLLYTHPVTETLENQQLVLANADGSNAQVYLTLKFGMFAGWSPDSAHFLYQSDGNTFVGASGQQPQPLSGLINAIAARWVAPGQLVYLLDEPDSSVLVWQPLDGPAASLSTLPAGVTFDALPAK